jgi:ketosteroid isomerase-like protein
MFSQAWAGDIAASKEIQDLFDQVAASFDKKDVDGIAKAAMPDATIQYLGGKTLSIDQWQVDVKEDFAEIETMQSKFEVEKTIGEGNSAFATYTETHDYVLASEKDHHYRSVSRWRTTLTRTSQGWRVVYFVQLFEQITRDGKPLTTPTPPEKL